MPVHSADMRGKRIIGWSEFVGLPDWGIRRVRAKIDTGARTSALHVENIRKISAHCVRFDVVLSRNRPTKRVTVEADIVRVSRVRPSTGHRQERYVVATTARIGGLRRRIELSLVSREHMICRMLLGRTSLGGFLVDASRRFVCCKGDDRGKPGDIR